MKAAAAQTLAPKALFFHPDDTSEIDKYDDPAAELAKLGQLTPIVRGVGTKFGNIQVPNMFISSTYDDKPSFMAATWEAGRAVALNPSVFSNSLLSEPSGPYFGQTFNTMDAPMHMAHRAPFQESFSPKAVASWQERLIKPVLDRQFARIKCKGRADLVRDLNVYWPYEIVCTMLGCDSKDQTFVAECLKAIQAGNYYPQACVKASDDLFLYCQGLVEEKRKNPQDDLISYVLRVGIDAAENLDEFLACGVMQMMAGGIDTVYKMSSNLAYLLLTHPEQFEMVKADRTLIPNAVEEGLRLQPVGSWMARIALEDAEVLGTSIPKGSVVWINHAAMNRDPSRWSNPNAFDVRREPQSHSGFGVGHHICVGMHLARLELRQYLEHLIDDLPNLRWDPDLVEIPRITGWSLRGILSMPVVWDV